MLERMERQEGVEREDHSKGVRRPRSDGARRPRPQSGLVAGAPAGAGAGDVHPGSHVSYDSHREPQHPGSGRDRSAERRPGDKYVDVRERFSFFVEFLREVIVL